MAFVAYVISVRCYNNPNEKKVWLTSLMMGKLRLRLVFLVRLVTKKGPGPRDHPNRYSPFQYTMRPVGVGGREGRRG